MREIKERDEQLRELKEKKKKEQEENVKIENYKNIAISLTNSYSSL